MHRLIASLALLGLLVLPAQAGPRARCDTDDDKPGLHIEYGISIGHRSAETDLSLKEMQLRQHGVKPRDVQRTSDGCLQVLVQNPDGSWNTQYYDEDTFELVQD